MPPSHLVARAADSRVSLPGYEALLDGLTTRIRDAHLRAAAAVNLETVTLYYDMGLDIQRQQQVNGWGAGVIEQLAADLTRRFPGARGYSARNLRYMRAFADAWPDRALVQSVLARIPWYHNLTLLEKLTDGAERLWYADQARNAGGRATCS